MEVELSYLPCEPQYLCLLFILYGRGKYQSIAVARSDMHSCIVFASSFEKTWFQLNSFSLNQITARLVARSVWSTPELVKCMVVKISRRKNLKKYIIDNIIIQYYWYDFYSLLWQFIIINSFIQKLSSTLFKSTTRTLELQILELHDN